MVPRVRQESQGRLALKGKPVLKVQQVVLALKASQASLVLRDLEQQDRLVLEGQLVLRVHRVQLDPPVEEREQQDRLDLRV